MVDLTLAPTGIPPRGASHGRKADPAGRVNLLRGAESKIAPNPGGEVSLNSAGQSMFAFRSMHMQQQWHPRVRGLADPAPSRLRDLYQFDLFGVDLVCSLGLGCFGPGVSTGFSTGVGHTRVPMIGPIAILGWPGTGGLFVLS